MCFGATQVFCVSQATAMQASCHPAITCIRSLTYWSWCCSWKGFACCAELHASGCGGAWASVTQRESKVSLSVEASSCLQRGPISHAHRPTEVCACRNVFWPEMSPWLGKNPGAISWWHQQSHCPARHSFICTDAFGMTEALHSAVGTHQTAWKRFTVTSNRGHMFYVKICSSLLFFASYLNAHTRPGYSP